MLKKVKRLCSHVNAIQIDMFSYENEDIVGSFFFLNEHLFLLYGFLSTFCFHSIIVLYGARVSSGVFSGDWTASPPPGPERTRVSA